MRAGRLRATAVLAALMGPAPPVVAAPAPLLLATPPLEEALVPAGRYYVGRAMGDMDFAKLSNASTGGFLIGRRQVTGELLATVTTWGGAHGYTFEEACKTCRRDEPAAPAADVSWRNAALLANALSEMEGLDPVYRDAAGQPVRSILPHEAIDGAVVEPSLSGFRLPTIPEWQIALRGADKALAAGTYGAPPAAPNALGLVDVAGPLAEWTATPVGGDARSARFVCNVEQDGARALSQCAGHPTGWADAAVGFRLVRRAPAAPPPVAAPGSPAAPATPSRPPKPAMASASATLAKQAGPKSPASKSPASKSPISKKPAPDPAARAAAASTGPAASRKPLAAGLSAKPKPRTRPADAPSEAAPPASDAAGKVPRG